MASTLLTILAAVPFIVILLGPRLISSLGISIGAYLRTVCEQRKTQLFNNVREDEKKHLATRAKKNDSDEEWEEIQSHATGLAENGGRADEDWHGIVAFFHPFCNAGGGGERVLWAAIRATQQRWPQALCVVYTGDHDVDKSQILDRVNNRFGIDLHAPTVAFLYLTTRRWVLPSTWPHFTLLGQSLGSLILAYDAFSMLVPDIFVDTMGYAFSLGLSKFLFPEIPTGAYVHYPTISTDMLGSLDSAPGSTLGVNAGKGAGLRGALKKNYWNLFAILYSRVGATVDIVMTNSSWTAGHIRELWNPYRTRKGRISDISVVFPPVAVEEMEREVAVDEKSEARREKILLYIAQFRPEKNHQLILDAFAHFKKSGSEASKDAILALVGSVRDDGDKTRVYSLKLAVNELQIKNSVQFHTDVSWTEILEWLRKASVGVNGMWNEHFGIGVVEYQAAGLIAVVHDSGGPKVDIVTDVDGLPTGFHATTAKEFADGFERALALPNKLAVRTRARKSAQRFTESEFAKRWVENMELLVELHSASSKPC